MFTINSIYGCREWTFVNSACSSSGHAMVIASQLIATGILDTCFVVGAEAPISPPMMKAWDKLRVMSADNQNPEKACRPFSKCRTGIVLSELAACVLLSCKRPVEAHPGIGVVELLGYGMSNDATSLTHPDEAGQAHAYSNLFENTSLTPDQIDYIQAHGTGTAINDRVETAVIKSVYGEKAYGIPITACKSLIGHSLGAASLAGSILTFEAMKHGTIPQTHNYMTFDPDCDLDYVTEGPRKRPVGIAVVHTFAFGGSNVILAFRH